MLILWNIFLPLSSFSYFSSTYVSSLPSQTICKLLYSILTLVHFCCGEAICHNCLILDPNQKHNWNCLMIIFQVQIIVSEQHLIQAMKLQVVHATICYFMLIVLHASEVGPVETLCLSATTGQFSLSLSQLQVLRLTAIRSRLVITDITYNLSALSSEIHLLFINIFQIYLELNSRVYCLHNYDGLLSFLPIY